jgi:hypothetical protein
MPAEHLLQHFAMTGNEATLLGAFGAVAISAVVAWRVAVYTVKHGPDYQRQLNEMNDKFGRLSAAQEGILAHHRQTAEDERARQEVVRWKPRMSITGDPSTRSNKLTIFANKHFRIGNLRLATQSGAAVADIPAPVPDGTLVKAAEIDVPHDAILKLVNNDPDYLRNSKTIGKLLLTLRVGDDDLPFEVMFRAVQEITNNNVWTRLDG